MSACHISSGEFQAILLEHDEIEKSVRAFSRMRARDVRGRPRRVRALSFDLERLRRRLQRHFEHEECRDGFFEEILDESPELVGEVDKLRMEHGEFLVVLGRVVRTLGTSGESRVDHAFVGLHRFVDAYLQHEDTENRMLLDLLNNDVGFPG